MQTKRECNGRLQQMTGEEKTQLKHSIASKTVIDGDTCSPKPTGIFALDDADDLILRAQ